MVRLQTLHLSLLGTLLLGAGCHYDPVPEPEDCDARFSSEALGVWELTADGLRHDCKDPDLNGDLTLEMQPFRVTGTPLESDGSEAIPETDSEADAFVERIRRARYQLKVSDRVGFEFEGTADTCSVDFTIREELKGDSFHEYQFKGYVTSSGRIDGNFMGRGPSRCKSEGNFEIDLGWRW